MSAGFSLQRFVDARQRIRPGLIQVRFKPTGGTGPNSIEHAALADRFQQVAGDLLGRSGTLARAAGPN